MKTEKKEKKKMVFIAKSSKKRFLPENTGLMTSSILHYTGIKPVPFFGAQSSLGGHISRLGGTYLVWGAQAVIWGAKPEMTPVALGLLVTRTWSDIVFQMGLSKVAIAITKSFLVIVLQIENIIYEYE